MSSSEHLGCFKAYDVRGRLGSELNNDIAYRIGRALVQSLQAKTVVVGFDARETSPSLAKNVALGVCDSGADVLDIGFGGTEQMYAAVATFNACAGIEVTASHNPIDYNGMKFVKDGSQPLSKNDFFQLKKLAEFGKFLNTSNTGSVLDVKDKALDTYLEKIIDFVDLKLLKPLKIVINSGNGAAGPIIDALNKKIAEKGVLTNFSYLHHNPDFLFPNGIPNPLLEENRSSTKDAILSEKADFGVAFDGDFDRCFLFDCFGNFIPGEYLVGLLSEVFLRKEKGATIIHDPRVVWNTNDIVSRFGGKAVVSKTGHALVKASMRETKAIYGGEMSAHHYFREYFYCDSGMIPWLLIWELLSIKDISLAKLLAERKALYPSSGEINFTVSNCVTCFRKVKDMYAMDAHSTDEIDGLSMNFKNWRFNLRQSNTEPLVRLNIETKGDHLLLQEKLLELSDTINSA